MACHSYQTYPSHRGCKSCGCSERSRAPWNWNDLYFPDFVANACCNPCCAEDQQDQGGCGCHVCNGGGCGNGCGGPAGGCHGYHPWYPCCGGCTCGCQDWWGCRNGICPR